MTKRTEHHDKNPEAVVLWTPWGLQPTAKPEEQSVSAVTDPEEIHERLAEDRDFGHLEPIRRLN